MATKAVHGQAGMAPSKGALTGLAVLQLRVIAFETNLLGFVRYLERNLFAQPWIFMRTNISACTEESASLFHKGQWRSLRWLKARRRSGFFLFCQSKSKVKTRLKTDQNPPRTFDSCLRGSNGKQSHSHTGKLRSKR